MNYDIVTRAHLQLLVLYFIKSAIVGKTCLFRGVPTHFLILVARITTLDETGIFLYFCFVNVTVGPHITYCWI